MADSTKVESKLPTLPRNPMPSHPDSAAAAPPGFPFRRAWQACLAWLGDVPIPDPDLRANAVLIQVLGALGALGLGLGALMRALGPAPLPPGPGRVLILSAVLLALGPVLVRLGHFRGSLGCISAALFVNVGAAMIGGGVTHGLGLTREAVIPLAIAALLLDRRTLWGMYGLIVAICTLGMAREHGLLGPAVHYPVAVPPFGAFGSTVIVFLFITVNILLYALVVVPVRKLRTIADEVSLGAMDAPEFPTAGTEEMASLGQSFNRMRRSLVEALAMLQDAS